MTKITELISQNPKKPSHLMMMGFICSLLGTMLVEGSIAPMIALGFLPITWLPVYTTVTRILDASSMFIARYIHKLPPGNTLIFCESANIGFSIIALSAILFSSTSPILILPTYLLAISFLPTVIDLAEEMYAETLSRESESRAANFNTTMLMLIPIASSVVARPIGSLFVDISVSTLIFANIILSLLALYFRLKAVKLSRKIEHLVTPQKNPQADFQVTSIFRFLNFSPGSALLVPTLSLASGMTSIYLTIWIASHFDSPATTISLLIFAGGIGTTVGPWIGRRTMRKYRFTSVAVFCLLLLFILHLTGFIALKTELFLSTASTAFISCSLAYIFLTGAATGGIFLINVTARQKRYRGEEFANALGVSHTLSAILFALGSWIGLTLNVEKDPAIALLLAALITAIPLFVINRKDTLRHEGN